MLVLKTKGLNFESGICTALQMMVAPSKTSTYRPSASLILAAKEDSSNEYDYSVSSTELSQRTKLIQAVFALVTCDQTHGGHFLCLEPLRLSWGRVRSPR